MEAQPPTTRLNFLRSTAHIAVHGGRNYRRSGSDVLHQNESCPDTGLLYLRLPYRAYQRLRFRRFADTALWAKIAHAIVPNFQVFWISDAIYEGATVPAKYLLIGVIYAALYTAGILMLAISLFQKRQVG